MNSTIDAEVRFGHSDDTVRNVLASQIQLMRSRSLLVTCVDSCTSPALQKGWMGLLAALGIDAKMVGDYAWIPGESLSTTLRDRSIFAGFDEVYIVNSKPTSIGNLKTFTSDWFDMSSGIPDELRMQMEAINAIGYLSDGCGLNYVLKHELAAMEPLR